MFVKTVVAIAFRVFFAVVISAAILSAFIALPALAEIRDGQRLEELVVDAKPGDWVVFDIDHTLLLHAQTYGGEAWFKHNLRGLMAQGLSSDEAFSKTVIESREISEVTDVLPSQTGLVEMLEGLRARGVVVFALTARHSKMSESTARQLRDIGLDFSSTAPVLNEGVGEEVEHAVIQDGIAYANDKPKGETILALLHASPTKPLRIFMADDKKHNLESVEKAALESGIAFEGYRYAGLDSMDHEYNPAVADVQRAHFKETGILLSDEMAEKHLKKSAPSCKALLK